MDPIRLTLTTGDPRSGTSMLMQCCDLAGVPVMGNFNTRISRRRARPPGRSGTRHRMRARRPMSQIESLKKKRSKKLNPRGYYELPGVVLRGVQRLNKHIQGKMLKVIAGGVWERELPDGRRVGTPPGIVARYLLCLRHPRSIIESQQGLLTNVFTGPQDGPEDAGDNKWDFAPQPLSAAAYLNRMGGFLGWFSEQPQDVWGKFLPVQFDDMLHNTEQTLAKVFEHIGHTPGRHRMALAVGNVTPKLRRSVTLAEWPEEMVEAGALADMIYEALSSMDRDTVMAAAIQVEEHENNVEHEGVTWVDDEDTWHTIRPKVKRQVLTNEGGLRDVFRRCLKTYRRHYRISDQCDHYSRKTNKTYTVDRPPDLGPLVRPMVACGRDDVFKTVEQCKACWQRGSVIDGELRDPQRAIQLGVK